MCKRQMVMDCFKFDRKPYGLPTLLMFEGGNHFHDMVKNWFRQSKRYSLLHEELNVSDGLPKPITGKLDVVFKDNETGQVILADIKTAMPLMFKKFMDSLPKDNHVIQLTAYAYGLNKMGIKHDRLALMYFDRAGSNKPLIYIVKPYKDIKKLFDEYILAYLRYEQDGILPDRLVGKTWECDYCDFNGVSCEGYIEKKKDAFLEFVESKSKGGIK